MNSSDDYYGDLGIIGGGVGGMGAAIIAAYKGLKVTLFEGGNLGGLVETLYGRKILENYPGSPSILSRRLIDEFEIQIEEVQAEVRYERVIKIKKTNEIITIITNEGEYNFRCLIIATGSSPSELGIEGERRFKIKDRGVYNFVSDPNLFKRSTVMVVGGGDTAIDAVHMITENAKKIYLVHRRDSFRAAETKVHDIIDNHLAEIIYNHQIIELKGDQVLEKAVIQNVDTNLKREIEIDKCILAVGMTTNLDLYENLGLETDGKLIKVDREMRTNIPGIFAIGDIVSHYQLIVIAVAQGAIAAHNAFGMIRKPYWYKDEGWKKEVS